MVRALSSAVATPTLVPLPLRSLSILDFIQMKILTKQYGELFPRGIPNITISSLC